MRGRVRRFGVIHEQKMIDSNGFPVTFTELLRSLETSTYQYKGEAVLASRRYNAALPPNSKRAYASVIWIDVVASKAGKTG